MQPEVIFLRQASLAIKKSPPAMVRARINAFYGCEEKESMASEVKDRTVCNVPNGLGGNKKDRKASCENSLIRDSRRIICTSSVIRMKLGNRTMRPCHIFNPFATCLTIGVIQVVGEGGGASFPHVGHAPTSQMCRGGAPSGGFEKTRHRATDPNAAIRRLES